MACFGPFDGPIDATILAGLGLIYRPDQGVSSVVPHESFLIGLFQAMVSTATQTQIQTKPEVSAETIREFWDRRPCNIRHSPLEVGSTDYFNEIERRRYFVEPHIKEFADLDRWDVSKVLEIGCGIGTDTISFARGGAQITAVDLSPKSLQLAKKRSHVVGFSEQVDFREADAEELSDYVPPEAYDLVYSFGVIHHTIDPKKVIQQVRDNFVRPGSTFKSMVYNRYSWKVL
jgi:2-polyprenyl-3-methyl-5-hydroxy-6-metoxy-1,4-benzoquinol methylase